MPLAGNLITVVATVCGMLEAAVVQRVATEAAEISDLFRPISLKYPAEKRNEIEIIRKRGDGTMFRVRIRYVGSRASYLISEIAPPGDRFRDLLQGVPDPIATDQDGKYLVEYARSVNKIKQVVCDSADPSVRSRYENLLQENRRGFDKLGSPDMK